MRDAPPADPRTARLALNALVAVSAVLLAVRFYAAAHVGFGDSEALYACYALHPQPAYLDHPGLVGLFARALGGGTAPSPAGAHWATAILATLVPWTMALACRAAGATWARAWAAALVVALVPEVAIGLFAMTPDLLLALGWIGSLALAAAALSSPPGSTRAFAAFAGAGLLAGVAAASKVTGIALLAALATTYASRPARAHARSLAPWGGLAAGALVMTPILAFEAHTGWPMLRHRLVDTQAGAGLSLRNVLAVAGGQVAYLSPLVAWLAVRTAAPLWRMRDDPVGRLLATACFLPLAALAPLCLWSRVAEPHWVAPCLLALVPAAARAKRAPSRRLVFATCAVAGAAVLTVYAWVLVPALLRFAPRSYDARLDLANELRGWPEVVPVVRAEAHAAWTPASRRGDVVVVGPHWVICAQLDAALRGEAPVGCASPIRDDFDDWWPRARWRRADTLVWVTDARFGPPPNLPAYAPIRVRRVHVERAGRTVRTFTISVLSRRVPT